MDAYIPTKYANILNLLKCICHVYMQCVKISFTIIRNEYKFLSNVHIITDKFLFICYIKHNLTFASIYDYIVRFIYP